MQSVDLAQRHDLPRAWMLGASLALGVFLYGVSQLSSASTPPHQQWALMLGALSGASFFLMSARRGALAQTAAVATTLALVLGGMTARLWVLGSVNGAHTGDAFTALMAAWLPSAALLWLMALSWTSARIDWLQNHKTQEGSKIYPYLFQHAWSHAALLFGMGIFVGACWVVLALLAALLNVLGIRFLLDLITWEGFVVVGTSLMAGSAAVVLRAQSQAVAMMLRIVMAMHHALAPLVAAGVLLTVAAVAVRGVGLLWQTGYSALLLMGLQGWMLSMVNGVYQDGQAATLRTGRYPRGVAAVVHVALIALPLLGALALWGIYLRVQQYGWTFERGWAAVGAVVLLGYSTLYAIAALGSWGSLKAPQAPKLPENGPMSLAGSGAEIGHQSQPAHTVWLRGLHVGGLGWTNQVMSVVLMVALLALNTEWGTPLGWAAASQSQRLAQAAWPFDEDVQRDFKNLRFDHGHFGSPAIAQLIERKPWPDEAAVEWLHQLLQARTRADMHDKAVPPQWTEQDLRAYMPAAVGHPEPAQSFRAAMWQQQRWHHLCLPEGHKPAGSAASPAPQPPRCVVLHLPMRLAAQERLPVLCELAPYATRCHVFEQVGDDWRVSYTFRWSVYEQDRQRLHAQIRAGKLSVTLPTWGDVRVEGLEDLSARED